jgi:type II secretory pathway pseudopilin PulG
MIQFSERKRAGYSLLEMMVVMWALTAVLGLGMALLLTAMRADQVGAATLRDLTRRTELADQFRTDVARAVEAPDRLDKVTAGPACLILRTAAGPVIYRWHDGTLDRTVLIDGKESRRPIAVGEDSTVEFIRPAGERPVVTVRVVTSPPRGMVARTEISAALGGDTR